jgi:hypothetical protein
VTLPATSRLRNTLKITPLEGPVSALEKMGSDLRSAVRGQVHHAVEQQALRRYPGLITDAEMNSLENLRGIPKNINSDPIDVVQTRDGLVTVDHTRPAVARELGLSKAPVRVHAPGDPLPANMKGRFGTARTWGEALEYRTGKQVPPLPPTGTAKVPRLPKQ